MTCDQLAIASESDKSITQGNSPLVGSVATISCPPEMVLIGPNVTTCMENGYWELDPESTVCKGELIMLIIMTFY